MKRVASGQSIVEYSVIAGIISLAAIVGLSFLGNGLDNGYQHLSQSLLDSTTLANRNAGSHAMGQSGAVTILPGFHCLYPVPKNCMLLCPTEIPLLCQTFPVM
jgi:Flp pilus assembly pilin Flp